MSLALSRRLHQRISIDIPPSGQWQHVEIEVARLSASHVELAFDAAREIVVLRDELRLLPEAEVE